MFVIVLCFPVNAADIGGLFLHSVILNGVQMITNGTAQISV